MDTSVNRKFVVVLNKGLDAGVALNAAAHMAVCLDSIAAGFGNI